MKIYKVRLNCSSFVDVVVEASNKEDAMNEAKRVADTCPDDGWEFGEFLEVEDGEEAENI